MIDPTKLDRRVTIERATTTRNAMGELVRGWTTIATVWAAMTPIKDGERLTGGVQVMASISIRWTIRWSPTVKDVSPLDRIAYDGKVHDIAGVKELGRKQGLEITTSNNGNKS